MANQKINLYFVLGGAVSAGAYTAGVFDFFIEKLKKHMDLPSDERSYDIKIKAITGASAGAMCGAIITNGFAKGWAFGDNNQSPLYQAWVKKIDIKELVKLDDLSDRKVRSLLNGNALKKIADELFKDTPSGNEVKLPVFVPEDFKLILSVTNTTGLSYAIDFINKDLKNPYFITNHRDYFNFTFEKTSDIEYITFNNDQDWDCLKKVAIASGAFPIGLPPVLIERPVSIYKKSAGSGLTPFNIGGETIRYYAIDGGTVDNEPLIKIIEMLEKDKEEAEQIVIFIDPFPSDRNIAEGESLKDNLSRLYTVLRDQSSFKPAELRPFLENSDEAGSKKMKTFFIAPKRRDTGIDKLQVAGGVFNAFGGFFEESFRNHDYILGKRNCQHFLQEHLKMNDADRIIKVDLGIKIDLPPWPSIDSHKFKKIGQMVNKRIRKVLKILTNEILAGLLMAFIKPSKFIENDLARNGLIIKK